MADLSVELAELNSNAKKLLDKHDKVFTRLEEIGVKKVDLIKSLTQQEIAKIRTLAAQKLSEFENKNIDIDAMKAKLQKVVDSGLESLTQKIEDIDIEAMKQELQSSMDKSLQETFIYFTYGRLKTTNRYNNSNNHGVDNFAYNYCFIDCPSGYSIGDLVVFMPSISKVYYAGDVNGDDTIYCHWKIDGNRIKVTCNNSENRADSYINFIAGWRK